MTEPKKAANCPHHIVIMYPTKGRFAPAQRYWSCQDCGTDFAPTGADLPRATVDNGFPSAYLADAEEFEKRSAAFVAAIESTSTPCATEGEAWQSIETAPKDGTRVLVYSLDRQYVGWYERGAWRFYANPSTGALGTILNATHWQPLPAPPSAWAKSRDKGEKS
jgi:hypothetical protein